MSGEPPFFVEIDGKWHEMPSDEVTRCGLDIPFGVEWTRTKPAKLHCGKDVEVNPEPMQEVLDALPEPPVPTQENVVAEEPAATKEAKPSTKRATRPATKAKAKK